MQLIDQSFVIEQEVDGEKILQAIERAGRTCYKSEDKISSDSAKKFVKMIVASGHHSVLEHEKITVRVIIDRGVSHEAVRHRICSFSQESTRYCNYSKNKFGGGVTCININKYLPDNEAIEAVYDTLLHCEKTYLMLTTEKNVSPQIARAVLPTCLKTEIVITANLREWRTIFTQRTAEAAHPQMRELMRPMLKRFRELIPVVFDDVGCVED